MSAEKFGTVIEVSVVWADDVQWLRAAMAIAAREAAEHFMTSGNVILELHSSHEGALQEACRSAPFTAWLSDRHMYRDLEVMLSCGRATVLWTWPDANSVSLLDTTRSGRRVVVRKASAT